MQIRIPISQEAFRLAKLLSYLPHLNLLETLEAAQPSLLIRLSTLSCPAPVVLLAPN
jgi:hypothetical protein